MLEALPPAFRAAVRSSPHEARGAKSRPRRTARRQTRQTDQRSSTAATVTTPSSRPAGCARTLDHGRSLGALHQASAHGIERDITDGGEEMILVHRHRAEPRLPEISGPTVARIDVTGGAPVQIAEPTPQPLFVLRRHDGVHMVRHQAISPDQRRPWPPRCRANPDKADRHADSGCLLSMQSLMPIRLGDFTGSFSCRAQ
jgi:hypothetical protein